MLRTAHSLWSRDPRLLLQAIRGKICFRARSGVVDGRVGHVRFMFDLDLDPRVRSMGMGIYEWEVRKTLRNLLSEGDTFIDVGANIGYLSAVAADLVGSGRVIAFEPVPKYFERLRQLSANNPNYNIEVYPFALGATKATARIDVTSSTNLGWNTMVPGFMHSDAVGESHAVDVVSLDELWLDLGLDQARVVKVDVEGFEFSVLKGMARTVAAGKIDFVVCEIAPAAYDFLAETLDDFSSLVAEMGLEASDLEMNPIKLGNVTTTTNVLLRRTTH